MKWVYLPAMFALAFLYTKISFNNFEIQDNTFSRMTSRRPGSVTEPKNKITSLYKVPAQVFYKTISADDLLIFSKVASFKGVVVGDVHVESFGFIEDDKKKFTFTINDFSEVTRGALFHDVLAHLVSAKALDKRVGWIEYFEAYKKGLKGESFPLSFYPEKGLEEAALNAEKSIQENISKDFPFEFTKFKKTHHHVNAVVKSQIHNEMTKLFPKIQFFDLVESNQEQGLYQMLVRVRPQDKIEWLEVEESTYCDYDLNFNQENASAFNQRFDLLKSYVYAGKLDYSLSSFKLDKKFFTVKKAEQFISKLQLDEIPSEDYHDIVMDEAYALGRIHSRSLGEDTENYIKAWATIQSTVIDEKTVTYKFKLKDYFKENRL